MNPIGAASAFVTAVALVASSPAVARAAPGEPPPAASPSALASAPPRLSLDRCLGLDRSELRRALEHELSGLGAQKTSLVVTAICEDAVTAIIRVARAGAAAGDVAERRVALGEVSTELRPRLLSLVAVELAEAILAAPPPPVAPPLPPRASPLSREPDLPSPSTSEAGLSPALSSAPAQSAPTQLAASSPPSTELALRSSSEEPSVGDVARSWQVGLRPAARIYAQTPHVLLSMTAELELPWISVGAVGGLASMYTHEPDGVTTIGQVTPYFLGVTARRQLDCLDFSTSALCFNARVEAGMSDVQTPDLSAHLYSSPSAPYALGAVSLEARSAMADIEVGVWLELGWSEGAVAYAFDSELASFDGLAASLGLSVRWPR